MKQILTRSQETLKQQRASVMGDVELEDADPCTTTTGYRTSECSNKFQALFPNDPTGAAIAMRGNRRV